MRPRLTLLLGDRNGIGPELVAKVLADDAIAQAAELEILGDPAVLAEGQAIAGQAPAVDYRMSSYRPVADIVTEPGVARADAGREMLACLSQAVRRVAEGEADGVVFAPLNKQAMHMGGLAQRDEMEFIAGELGCAAAGCGELNVLERLWTTRVTSHIPLSEVAAHITTENVLASIRFAHRTLLRAGYAEPRVAVAALNPHAGDGGNFGREEIDAIGPALRAACAGGIVAEGPFPSDTVFVRARRGAHDVVVTMYHDQGQIAMKLMGFGQGVTVLGGLPVAITTCAHGTGYDIVGQGVAVDGALKSAIAICREMVLSGR